MDYFNQRTSSPRGPGTNSNNAAPATPGGRRGGMPAYESLRAPSAIRIRRLPSGFGSSLSRPVTQEGDGRTPGPDADSAVTGRRRSLSAPQGYGGPVTPGGTDLSRLNEPPPHMPAITEGVQTSPHPEMGPGYPRGADASRPVTPSIQVEDTTASAPHSAARRSSRYGLNRLRSNTSTSSQYRDRLSRDEYDSDVIDLLDLVDPEIRTIGTLTNLQNSLFIPDLGGLVNRRPTYDLTSRHPTSSRPATGEGDRKYRSRAGTHTSRVSEHAPQLDPIQSHRLEMDTLQVPGGHVERGRRASIGSELSDSRYAVLPHGVSLEGWSDEEIEELNDHVRHLLHSRREGFKRGWRGFRKYISRPLGLFVFVYATLVTLFGAAWVFCLIGWIYVGSKQDYFIDVIDNVLVALFALMGDGLAPFRAVDTYHMCFIAHYHHLTWRLRQEKKLPDLVDHNDLPDRHVDSAILEDIVDKEETAEYSVLTARQQKRLQYHQAKFNKSHTFYKPHETSTHHAFPLRLLVAVVVLLDCHSLFQVALGTCTWSIDYRVRPQALTATILSCSITCNIMAGVLISVGDHKTRKKDVLERIFRQGLTEEALKRMARKHDRGEMAIVVDPVKVESEEISDAVRDATGVHPEERSKSLPRDPSKPGTRDESRDQSEPVPEIQPGKDLAP